VIPAKADETDGCADVIFRRCDAWLQVIDYGERIRERDRIESAVCAGDHVLDVGGDEPDLPPVNP
jgi:hypothetical protein